MFLLVEQYVARRNCTVVRRASNHSVVKVATSTSRCTAPGVTSIQWCLNAPSLAVTDASTGQVIETAPNSDYYWLRTSLSAGGVAWMPQTGVSCGSFFNWSFRGANQTTAQCALGNGVGGANGVPDPLTAGFAVAPPLGTVTSTTALAWVGAQEYIAIVTHAWVASAASCVLAP